MTFPTKVPRNAHALITLRYLSGELIKSIAYDYGCSLTVIRRIAARNGAPHRNAGYDKCPPRHQTSQSPKSPSTSTPATLSILSDGRPTGPPSQEK